MVILAGLLSSTVLNMVVLPTLYLRYGEHGLRTSRSTASMRPAAAF